MWAHVQLGLFPIDVQGIIVSIFSIGAVVGALSSGLLSDSAGRKLTVIIGACTSAVGGILQASSFHLWSDVSFAIQWSDVPYDVMYVGCCCQGESLVALELGMCNI